MAASNPQALTSQPNQLSKATILGMIAMGVAVLVVANDFTALSVALPAIEHDLHTDVTTVQWVINGYAMVFGVLIVTGGRLADMFGRRRIFMLGAAIFAAFSVIGGFAPSVWVLLACRFLMGIGGAMMWPAILGMTYGLLPREKAGLAGGVILGAAGFGNAVGPSARRLADRHRRLALDLLRQPARRRGGNAHHLHGRCARRLARASRRHRLSRNRRALARTAVHAARARLGRRSRLDRAAHPLPVRLLGGCAHRVPVHRAPCRRRRAGSRVGHAEPAISCRRNRHPAGLGHLLRRAALSAAVHVEESRLLRHRALAQDCCP